MNQNEKLWVLVFDPRALLGRDDAYIVGAFFDKLNIKETLKAGNLHEGLIFRHAISNEMLVVIRSHKEDKLILHELKYDKDWSTPLPQLRDICVV